jgi:hypothetical protein
MKYLALIPLLFVASCASHPTPRLVIKPLPRPAFEPAEAVRYAEVVRAYYIGRYIDPNHPDVMNDQHPIYRVEEHSHWNLKRGVSCLPSIGWLNLPPDAAYAPPPTNDVIIAELNRQKDATQRVMWEASRLARSYDELQQVIRDMSVVAKNHAMMNVRITNTECRVATFERELQKLIVSPSLATNDVPGLNIETPTTPNP